MQVLRLRSFDQLGADLLKRFDIATREGDADTVNFLQDAEKPLAYLE